MADTYIEKNRGCLTCSKIKLYMKSKEAYKKVYIDEVDTSFIKQSTALEKGTMVDKYILTRDEFDKEYAILDGSKKDDLIRQCLEKNIPVEKSDKVEDLKAKLVGNKQVLTDGEVEMLQGIERELKRQPLYNWEAETENQKEFIVEYKGLKLKGTLDRFDMKNKLIRDLKTTSDMDFNSYYDCTNFENKLIQNDEYQYGLQLAWYWVLVYIHTGEEFDGIIDGIKTSGNYAYEGYYYHKETLKQIAWSLLFPALDKLIEDTEKNTFVDEEERGKLINEKYYPILDSTIQKEYRIIEPSYY